MARAADAPEFILARACCRWPPSEKTDGAVRDAARAVDWPTFSKVAARHRVEGLAWRALCRAGVHPDPAAAGALAVAAADIARRGLVLAGESARLQSALDLSAIPNLILKGAALEQLARGAIGLKRAWDIDLLVAAADAARARVALEAAGYRLADPADSSNADFAAWTTLAKEVLFRHGQNGIPVELHWRLVDGAGLLPGLGVASPTQWVRLSAGISLRTLAPDAQFAYLCVHGAAHGWSRLKWLADLAALLSGEDPAELERLYRRSLELGAGRCGAVALLLCHDLLALELPADLEREMRRELKTRWLAATALDALAGGGATQILARPLASERILASHLLFADGWRYRRAEFARQWVSVHDRRHIRLPAPLYGLYGLIRAPLWLWRRVASSVRRP